MRSANISSEHSGVGGKIVCEIITLRDNQDGHLIIVVVIGIYISLRDQFQYLVFKHFILKKSS